MKKAMFRLLFVSCIIILSACSLHYRDTKDAIKTPTNVESLFQFQIGYSKDSVVKELGSPSETTKDYLLFKNPYVLVGLDKNNASYIITSAPKFKTVEGIHIGSSKDEVINTYRKKDLYQYTELGDDWIYYFTHGGVKVAFKLQENKVIQIATGVAPLSEIFNIDENVDIMDDKAFIKESIYLTYSKDVKTNNKKVMHEDFLQYASNGLVKNIPVPLGMDLSEVERKYGQANYVWEDQEMGVTELWYKAFNCSFLVSDNDNKVHGLKCPIDIEYDELKNVIGDFVVNDEKEILYQLDGRELLFIGNKGNRIDYFVVR